MDKLLRRPAKTFVAVGQYSSRLNDRHRILRSAERCAAFAHHSRLSSHQEFSRVLNRCGAAHRCAQRIQLWRGGRGCEFWSTPAAVDETRRKTEKAAFENLIGEIEKLWSTIVANNAA